jgi:hydroxyacylglutathione hydrolase
MKVTLIQVTPFQQNCSVIVCEETQRAAILDPGGDVDRIFSAVQQLGVTVEKVLLTHGHLDHCGGAKSIADHYGVKIEGPHAADAFWIDQLPEQSKRSRRTAGCKTATRYSSAMKPWTSITVPGTRRDT